MSNEDSTKAPERFLMSPPLPSPHDSPAPGPEVTVLFGARSRRGPLRFQNDDLGGGRLAAAPRRTSAGDADCGP